MKNYKYDASTAARMSGKAMSTVHKRAKAGDIGKAIGGGAQRTRYIFSDECIAFLKALHGPGSHERKGKASKIKAKIRAGKQAKKP